MPLGALITVGIVSKLFVPGDHGSTFGGNPVTTAAGLAAIREIEKKNLMKNAVKEGEEIKKALAPHVKEVRGQGLLLGIELHGNFSKAIADGMLKHGVLVNAPNSSTIRIAPPLNITTAQRKKFIEIFKKTLKEVGDGTH